MTFSEKSSIYEKEEIEEKTHWPSVCIATFILLVVALQFSIYFASLWPYMSLIDKSADQTFYGITLAAYSAGQMVASPLFGYWNNRIRLFRPMLATGMCLSIAGNIVYAFTESSISDRKWIIFGARIFCGIGAGIVGTIRAFMATASTPEHRARTIAIGTMAVSLGMTAGPALQACVTPIGYPGLVIGPLHINQYTAPAYISVAAMLILMALLFTVFRDQIIGIQTKNDQDPFHVVPSYDKTAAILCILRWFAVFFSVTNQETVESPYTMSVFNWSNGDAVFYNSIIMTCSAVISLVVFVGFAILGDRINFRLCIVIGLGMLGAFWIITFPWPIFTAKLIYTPANTSVAVDETVGCHFEWCNYTPQLPLLVYLIAYPLLSVGFPFCNVAASTLFAKLLGSRRQGLMQSIMSMAGCCSRTFGPLLISWLFSTYGPRVAWTMVACVVFSSMFSILIWYRRMVPLNMKPMLRGGDVLRYDGGLLYRF